MSALKATVYVTLKPEVLDPQGQAVQGSLRTLGFEGVSGVRVGKLIELQLEGERGQAEAQLEDMCRKLLANPVIETYRWQID